MWFQCTNSRRRHQDSWNEVGIASIHSKESSFWFSYTHFEFFERHHAEEGLSKRGIVLNEFDLTRRTGEDSHYNCETQGLDLQWQRVQSIELHWHYNVQATETRVTEEQNAEYIEYLSPSRDDWSPHDQCGNEQATHQSLYSWHYHTWSARHGLNNPHSEQSSSSSR